MATVTDTTSGRVSGVQRDGHVAFLGIPYAASPTGARRLRAPEPAQGWAGVRDATVPGTSALQGEAFAAGVAADGPTGEDCLYANVFTPAVDGRKRPVLVFVHGGAFIVGSASQPLYDGGRLAAGFDQVVVTFNYRLGALGFLVPDAALARRGAVANVGLLDQVAALRWVRDNVERFGGDPRDVTVFGESAGGTSVLLLLSMPAATGLFRRAIAQSPAEALDVAPPDGGMAVTEQLLAALDVPPGEGERLFELPAERIVAAQGSVRSTTGSFFAFGPVLDGASLPVPPRELLATGRGADVPLVLGVNRDEWNLFAPPLPADREPVPDVPGAIVAGGFPAALADRLPELVAVYRASRAERHLPHHDRAIVRAILGDLRFRMPTQRFADAWVGASRTAFAYLFTYGSPALRGALGACHALELPFVFGTLDAPMQDRFAGTGERVRSLSAALMRAWSSFARTSVPALGDGAEWPAYDATVRPTRILDVPGALEAAPLDEERRAWERLLPSPR